MINGIILALKMESLTSDIRGLPEFFEEAG